MSGGREGGWDRRRKLVRSYFNFFVCSLFGLGGGEVMGRYIGRVRVFKINLV